MADTTPERLSARDWHILLALADGPLHGYAIMRAVERDSGGAVTAAVGSLYRVLDRLLDDGQIAEVAEPDDAPDEAPGRRRRYYGLTERGRSTLQREALRLRDAVDLARERSLLPEGSS